MINTLIFAPAAVITIWDTSIKSLISSLEASNHKVTLIRCKGMYSEMCVSMPAFNVYENSSQVLKNEVCLNCIKCQKVSDRIYPINVDFLENFVSLREHKQINSVLDAVNIQNWFDFEFEGIKVGRIASYEFFLNHKIKDLAISEDHWQNLRKHIRNVLYTYFAAENYFRTNVVNNLVVYNRFYSVNNVFCQVAEKYESRVFSIQNEGPAFDANSRYHLHASAAQQLWLSKSIEWQGIKDKPLGIIKVFRVNRHLKHILGLEGTLMYSEKPTSLETLDNIYAKLNLRVDSTKVLVPTSSADERFTLEVLGYLITDSPENSDSLSVLKKLAFLAPSYPEFDFIFRIHPREFPNKRESVKSMHADDLMDFISSTRLPENLKINTPDDQISIANLAMVTDFVLNSTSTVGLDFVALGLKVIMYSPNRNFVYPNELNIVQPDLEKSLIQMKSQEFKNGFPHEKQVLAYRWIHFKYFTDNHKVVILSHDRMHRIKRILDRIMSEDFSIWLCALIARYKLASISLWIFDKKKVEAAFRHPTDRQITGGHRWLHRFMPFMESSVISLSSKKMRGMLTPKVETETTVNN